MDWTLGEIVTGVLAVASAVVLLANAGEKIVKVWKAAKAPVESVNARLERIEERQAEFEKFFAADKSRLDKLDDGNRVTQRALLALLAHGLDGNNVEQMQKAKDELEEYLISR